MEYAKRLYLIDEFDREYKQLQRPAAAVAKTRSAIRLTDTLRNSNLDEHDKVRRYVAELHRYLNVNDPRQRQSVLPTRKRARKDSPIGVNALSAPLPTRYRPPPPVASRVTTRSQIGLKQPALTVGDADKDDDDVEGEDGDDDDDEFHLAPLYEEKQPATASSLFQFTAEPSAKWKRKKAAATPGFDFNVDWSRFAKKSKTKHT